MKRIFPYVIIFTIIGLSLGIYYRELTKFMNFYDTVGQKTMLSVAHTHTLVLGAMIPLLLGLMLHQTNKDISDIKIPWYLYIIGVSLTIIMIVTRGSIEVYNLSLTKGLDASISGLAGLGHTMLGVGLVWILFKISTFYHKKDASI